MYLNPELTACRQALIEARKLIPADSPWHRDFAVVLERAAARNVINFNTVKADLTGSAVDWTPLDLLIDISEIAAKATVMVVCWQEPDAEGRPLANFRVASSNALLTKGLLFHTLQRLGQ
jgi:hypothetical protein